MSSMSNEEKLFLRLAQLGSVVGLSKRFTTASMNLVLLPRTKMPRLPLELP